MHTVSVHDVSDSGWLNKEVVQHVGMKSKPLTSCGSSLKFPTLRRLIDNLSNLQLGHRNVCLWGQLHGFDNLHAEFLILFEVGGGL